MVGFIADFSVARLIPEDNGITSSKDKKKNVLPCRVHSESRQNQTHQKKSERVCTHHLLWTNKERLCLKRKLRPKGRNDERIH